tara:strand:+ start:61 stop:504 length:444 start_codon:yes stop_codon:yes gene_type:complete
MSYPPLQKNDSEQVVEWQRFLTRQGINIGASGDDGAWGPDTRAATAKFQAQNELTPDGDPGPKTMEVAVTQHAFGMMPQEPLTADEATQNKGSLTPQTADATIETLRNETPIPGALGKFAETLFTPRGAAISVALLAVGVGMWGMRR